MTHLIETLNISQSPYVNAGLSILAFIAIAKAADIFVDKILRRFTSFTQSDLDDRILDAIHRPIYLTVSLVGVILAVIYLNPEEKSLYYINNLLKTAIVVVWTLAAFRISNASIETLMGRVTDATGLGKDVVPLVENVMKVLLSIVGIGVIFGVWKINITPLFASAGIAGAGIAFAAKDTLANLFGGVSVFFDKPYKVGDFIQLDKGERGTVMDIGLRSTRIQTPDNILITVPNSIISNSKIINESAPVPKLRVAVGIGVAYGSSIERVEEAMLAAASECEHVMDEPAPSVALKEFGDSALKFELLCWIPDPTKRPGTINQINRSLYRRFREAGIGIPFPQMDITVRNLKQ